MHRTQSTYESHGAPSQGHSARFRAIVGLSLLVLAWGTPALGQFNVTLFGPQTFVRETGKPQDQIATFFLPPSVRGQFSLTVENGNTSGTNRVSSASVALNGVEILGPSDFNQQVGMIRREVPLLPSNVLSVDLKSSPGAYITVSVSGAVEIVPEPLPEGVSGPLIESAPPTAAMVGKPLQYQVVTSSATPTSLTYLLSTAPAGMTISATTGLMQWTPTTNEAGDQQVTIVAQDSEGQTSQSFTLSVFGTSPGTSVLISAKNGGVITVNDPSSPINGLSINIPAGALGSDTTITVSALISPPTLGGTPRFLIKGFSLEPDGAPLSVPATVTIPYDVTQFSTAQGIGLEDFLGVYFVQTSTGSLEFLDNFAADSVNHVVTGTIPHFSVYSVSNIARLCPPPTAQTVCGNQYAPTNPSLLLPAVMIHGFQLPSLSGVAMGNETTWGQLRSLLSQQLDSGNSGRVDAWRFDWDSVHVSFERSAKNLGLALSIVERAQQSPTVNLVAHSFGGILVRTYLESQASFYPYKNDVNRVITLGTPYQGIGGLFSTGFANACADTAVLLPKVFTTCFEAAAGLPGTFGEGRFLTAINGLQLPNLNSSQSPQYDIVIGQRMECGPLGCALRPDDGLITTAGNQLTCATGSCINAPGPPEINPGNVPIGDGLCHSGTLRGLTCAFNNLAMAEIDDTQHPLWDKICDFLGCEPAINVTLNTPAGGTVTSNSQQDAVAINCGQNGQACTGLYPAGTSATLTATPSPGYTFTGWSGACSGSNPQCIVPIQAIDLNLLGYQVTANFSIGGQATAFIASASCTVVPLNPPVDLGGRVATSGVLLMGNGTATATEGYVLEVAGNESEGLLIDNPVQGCSNWSDVPNFPGIVICRRDPGQPSTTNWVVNYIATIDPVNPSVVPDSVTVFLLPPSFPLPQVFISLKCK